MFKRMLLPTDGSEIKSGIKEGVRFAETIEANIVGLYIISPQPQFTFETLPPKDKIDLMVEKNEIVAHMCLMEIQKAADRSGVQCELVCEISDRPHEAIVRVAQQKCCDLIFLTSQRPSLLNNFVINRESLKVLNHTKMPVLIYKAEQDENYGKVIGSHIYSYVFNT